MSGFFDPPQDDIDHCNKNRCGVNSTCFLYENGTLCQPFDPSPSNFRELPVPHQWYFGGRENIRFAGSIFNQSEGSNCTTMPVPASNSLFVSTVQSILIGDLRGAYSALDAWYPSTLLHFRGDCREGLYCAPTVDPNTRYFDITIRTSSTRTDIGGSFPGVCRSQLPENARCQSSMMCQGWTSSPTDGTARCQLRESSGVNSGSPVPPTSTSGGNFTSPVVPVYKGPTGICITGTKRDPTTGGDDRSLDGLKNTTRTYLLSTLAVFLVVTVIVWFRRRRQLRQIQERHARGECDIDGILYDRRGGVYRPTDNEDSGELPSYANHRWDEQVVGPAAEEIGMYNFPATTPANGSPPASTTGQGSDHPPVIIRPVQHTYPFPMNHPQLNTVLNPQQQTSSSVYPPPSSDPPPLTPQEAEAAALSAAAAAVVPASAPEDPLRLGGLLPPAYEHPVEGSEPSAASTAATATTIVAQDPLSTSARTTTTNTTEAVTVTGAEEDRAGVLTGSSTPTLISRGEVSIKEGKQEYVEHTSEASSSSSSSSSLQASALLNKAKEPLEAGVEKESSKEETETETLTEKEPGSGTESKDNTK